MLLTRSAPAPADLGQQLLPDYDYADAQAFSVPAGITARDVERSMFAKPPAWISALMDLRNRIAVRLGLESVSMNGFPALIDTDERVVLGLDDSHLDFRILIDLDPRGSTSEVTVATYVRRRNGLGRLYMAAVMPFHYVISRVVARKVAQALNGASA